MHPVELIQALESFPFDELRKKYEGYFEAVLYSHDLMKLYPILEGFFGAPFKPAGVAPSREAQAYAARYGGIQKNQTLYFKNDATNVHCAMIWPWADGSRVTIKVAHGLVVGK